MGDTVLESVAVVGLVLLLLLLVLEREGGNGTTIFKLFLLLVLFVLLLGDGFFGVRDLPFVEGVGDNGIPSLIFVLALVSEGGVRSILLLLLLLLLDVSLLLLLLLFSLSLGAPVTAEVVDSELLGAVPSVVVLLLLLLLLLLEVN